ncbi:hypothetical protein GCM10025734_05500 [Kitasatospora paranensis]
MVLAQIGADGLQGRQSVRVVGRHGAAQGGKQQSGIDAGVGGCALPAPGGVGGCGGGTGGDPVGEGIPAAGVPRSVTPAVAAARRPATAARRLWVQWSSCSSPIPASGAPETAHVITGWLAPVIAGRPVHGWA